MEVMVLCRFRRLNGCIVLSITLASRLVPPSYRGRAIGIIYMGISGSLVLGVPIGMTIGNTYGWRAPFLLIAGLSALAIVFISIFLHKSPPEKAVPLRKQLASLKNVKIVSGQLISFLLLMGHLTLYVYLSGSSILAANKGLHQEILNISRTILYT